LNGFLPPCEESPPNRFAVAKVRWGWSVFSLCWSECDIDSESLLVLVQLLVLGLLTCGGRVRHTWSGASRGSRGCPLLAMLKFTVLYKVTILSEAWWDK
jgi:hypothetical protein